jgi:predicted SAM-dependent methyltransferase
MIIFKKYKERMIRLLKKIKHKLPINIQFKITFLYNFYTRLKYFGFKYKCSVCGNKLNHFISLQNICDGIFLTNIHTHESTHSYKNYETFSIDKCLCPICGSADKTRLYALYLNSFLKYQKNKVRLLHFAPESGLPFFLKSKFNIEYRSADLFRNDVDDKIDLTDINYPDESWDLILCSHILEHIIDDNKAVKELYRILKPNGKAIIMVPIMLTLENNFEDNLIISEFDRYHHFGQEDHVRVYSKNGFINILERNGFKVTEYGKDFFGDKLFSENGITNSSILYVVTK